MALSPQYVKVKSSVVIFGGYEYESFRTNQLRPEFLVLLLRRKIDSETLSLQLSFKHIHKVELLDNSEGKGAGLVIHVNSFMAEKIQDALDKHGNDFISYRTSYAPNKFIVMDLLNCDPQSVANIKKVLQSCEDFHREYVIDQCNKARASGQDAALSLPTQYICPIHFNQWKSLLGSMQKDIIFDHIEMTIEGQKALRYTVGKICAYVPTEVYSLQQDGSLVSKRRVNDEGNALVKKASQGVNDRTASAAGKQNFSGTPSCINLQVRTLNRISSSETLHGTPNSNVILRQNKSLQQPIRYVVHSHQQQSSYLQPTPSNQPNHDDSFNQQCFNMKHTLDTPTIMPYSVGLRSTPARRNPVLAQKREIHVIEDEEDSSGEASAKKSNDTVFIYPSSGGCHSCSVHYSDLKFLDQNFMLNDTIIDFYLKYIYHELIPEHRREKIFMFNSFFYSRLAQSPSHVRTPVSMNTRLKRIQTNFQSIKSWTKRVNLFDKDYIIVPINEDIHWYLAVIINPSNGIIPEGDDSKLLKTNDENVEPPNDAGSIRSTRSSKAAYVVVFDSLIENDRKYVVVKELLAEYLWLEFNDKHTTMSIAGKGFNKSSLKLINPMGMPQQKNYVDCGVFLLQFAEIFMTNPPNKLSTQVAFRTWYPQFQIKGKRDSIKQIIKRIAPNVTYANFLPGPVVAKKLNAKKVPLNLEALMMQPTRTRRHSDSSIFELKNEAQFTSLGLSSRSRSLDSILEELKDMPPLVITFRNLLPNKRKSTTGNVLNRSIQ